MIRPQVFWCLARSRPLTGVPLVGVTHNCHQFDQWLQWHWWFYYIGPWNLKMLPSLDIQMKTTQVEHLQSTSSTFPMNFQFVSATLLWSQYMIICLQVWQFVLRNCQHCQHFSALSTGTGSHWQHYIQHRLLSQRWGVTYSTLGISLILSTYFGLHFIIKVEMMLNYILDILWSPLVDQTNDRCHSIMLPNLAILWKVYSFPSDMQPA